MICNCTGACRNGPCPVTAAAADLFRPVAEYVGRQLDKAVIEYEPDDTQPIDLSTYPPYLAELRQLAKEPDDQS